MSDFVIKCKARVQSMIESVDCERVEIRFTNPINKQADFVMALNPEGAAVLRVGMTVEIAITPVVRA